MTSTAHLTRLSPDDPSLGLADTVDRVYVVPGVGFVIRDTQYVPASRWIAVATLGDLTHDSVHDGRPLSCDAHPVHTGTLRDALRLMPSGRCR